MTFHWALLYSSGVVRDVRQKHIPYHISHRFYFLSCLNRSDFFCRFIYIKVEKTGFLKKMLILHNTEMDVIQEFKDTKIDQKYAKEVPFVYQPSQYLMVRAGLDRMSVSGESLKYEQLQKKNERPTESSQRRCAIESPTWIKSQKGGLGGPKSTLFPPCYWEIALEILFPTVTKSSTLGLSPLFARHFE